MSSVGEKWKVFYKNNQLSWFDSKQINFSYLQRFSKAEWITRFLSLAKLRSGSKILEAGCGTGVYALTFSQLGFTVDAFDYNGEALAIAQDISHQLRQEGLKQSPRFYQDNILSIQSSDNAYDFVFNQAVLDYFCNDEEKNKAIAEMVRVTKRGGKVGILVQHTGHSFHQLWKFLGWPGYTDQPPVRKWTPKDLQIDMEKAGLSDIQIDGLVPWKSLFFWPPWYQKWAWSQNLIYLVGRALSYIPLPSMVRAFFGIQIMAVGTKP